jgi:predicted dehydrogenase
MDDVTIEAACELDEDRLEAVVTEYDIPNAFTDYEAMLDEVELDGVYAIMEPQLLNPIVTDILKREENLFVEKPPGIAVEETRRWAALADEYDCKTCVGFQRRFHPLVVEAVSAITERSDVLYAQATIHKHRGGEPWLLVNASHLVDLLAWVGDGIENVRSVTGQLFADRSAFDPRHVNAYAAITEFGNGGIGILSTNNTAGGRYLGFEMHGEGVSAYGEIHGDAELDECVIHRDGESYARAERLTVDDVLDPDFPTVAVDGTFQINRHFVDCLAEDRTPDPNFADVIDTMEAIESIQAGDRISTVVTE